MKKSACVLALLLAVSTTPQLLSARVAQVRLTQSTGLTYAQGRADGDAAAADLAAQYGCGSAEYANAEDQAYYNTTHTDEPVYWRGYYYSLTHHC